MIQNYKFNAVPTKILTYRIGQVVTKQACKNSQGNSERERALSKNRPADVKTCFKELLECKQTDQEMETERAQKPPRHTWKFTKGKSDPMGQRIPSHNTCWNGGLADAGNKTRSKPHTIHKNKLLIGLETKRKQWNHTRPRRNVTKFLFSHRRRISNCDSKSKGNAKKDL